MKTKPILVLLLFVGVVAMVGWMYYAISHPAQPKEQPVDDGLHDLDACCRRKNIKATQYEHFARTAQAEQRPSAAALFHAMAHSERIQEANYAATIRLLGGSYHPPMRILLFHGTTDGNLRRSLDYERRSADSLLDSRIAHHLQGGYRRIAQALIRAAIIDFRHRQLLTAALTAPAATYAVCPLCGNLYATEECEPYCPHCLTARAQFVVIGE